MLYAYGRSIYQVSVYRSIGPLVIFRPVCSRIQRHEKKNEIPCRKTQQQFSRGSAQMTISTRFFFAYFSFLERLVMSVFCS